MSDCCSPQKPEQDSSCHSSKSRPDYLLWGSAAAVAVLYINYLVWPQLAAKQTWYLHLSHGVFDLLNTMWWGLVLGIVMVSVLTKIPREFVMSVLGVNRGLSGIARATGAGVLLDLCSHGILMVGASLYQRGASIGQVMAFIIASPWNSFSLTLILVALIGLKWTLVFILLSMLIAIITGLLFDLLVARGVLPENPNRQALPEDFKFFKQAKSGLQQLQLSPAFFVSMFASGLQQSQMVLRWLLFGVLLAAAIRAFVSADQIAHFFGPTLAGLGLTIVAATIIEVCSEGSTPIAADLLTRANAPGNSFAFLMTGVATDYTEIMVLKDVSRSWRIALFLPLLTVPQVLLVSWLINISS